MSMIIERALRFTAQAALVLGLWVGVMIAMPFIGPAGRQVAVVGDGARAVRIVAEAGGQVVEVRHGATLARSDAPDFVRRLYALGAPAVIEGRCTATSQLKGQRHRR
ncbi:hypothetical protein [Sphingomonas sanguinis]|jgi:hypothetical protein|uniref:hypothetical protein n=1 Tax=Sphingomonas sanguinis TaxID=33051 RepID=UPI001F0D5BF9|nr:hypothetical protein [Sphingomonas sanguinis]MBZ6381276.1 hypothetical protein [Sphingomonas sanguinis]